MNFFNTQKSPLSEVEVNLLFCVCDRFSGMFPPEYMNPVIHIFNCQPSGIKCTDSVKHPNHSAVKRLPFADFRDRYMGMLKLNNPAAFKNRVGAMQFAVFCDWDFDFCPSRSAKVSLPFQMPFRDAFAPRITVTTN